MNKSILLFFGILIVFTALGYGLVELYENNSALAVYGTEDHKVEEFNLVDQKDQTFLSRDHNGKIWIVNCFFTSCPIVCPKVMKNVQDVHDLLRNDESIVTISMTVDPKRDSPEKLFEYGQKYNANPKSWFLLTGEKMELYRLARKSFLLSASEGAGDSADFIHSENIVVVDPDHQIRAIINGTAKDADQSVLKAIKKLKREYEL